MNGFMVDAISISMGSKNYVLRPNIYIYKGIVRLDIDECDTKDRFYEIRGNNNELCGVILDDLGDDLFATEKSIGGRISLVIIRDEDFITYRTMEAPPGVIVTGIEVSLDESQTQDSFGRNYYSWPTFIYGKEV